MNFLQKWLQPATDYQPFDVPTLLEQARTALDINTLNPNPAQEPDYTNVEVIFAQAAKENAAMMNPETSVAAQLTTDLKAHQESLATQLETLHSERSTTEEHYNSEVERLNEERKSLDDIHTGALADLAEREADINVSMKASTAALTVLNPLPPLPVGMA